MTAETGRARPPVPTSVSPEAQTWLATLVTGVDNPEIDPSDTDAWLRHIADADAGMLAMFGSIAERLGIPVDETELGGVHTYVLTPHGADEHTPVYLDIHGGALILGAGELAWMMCAGPARRREMITCAVDYRMPPLHPYPAALDDCLAAYRAVLEVRAPEDVFVGGASAGGNLAAALVARAKDEGLPMPAGLVLLSPEVDLTEAGDSFATNRDVDSLAPHMAANLLYASGHDLADPYLSPLFADLRGFPPTLVQAGTRDLFLSNAVRMHRRLRDADVEAELHIWEAMPHGGFGFTAPEDRDVQREVRRFLTRLRRDRPS